MRDALIIPLSNEESLVLASDNSGAIGMKDADLVHVPYETVAYYALRVAAMECIAAGGEPFSVVLHNFCGNDPWEDLTKGIKKGLNELKLKDVLITGSTESNFTMLQSAVGLIVLGKKHWTKQVDLEYSDQLKFTCIGLPLVGNEVVKRIDEIVPLEMFQKVCGMKGVMVWPVGSKGVLCELKQMFPEMEFSNVMSDIDVQKSSGPATCFIAAFDPENEGSVKKLTGPYFHELQIER